MLKIIYLYKLLHQGLLIIILAFFLSDYLYSQDILPEKSIDSLKELLPSSSGESKIDLLNSLASEYSSKEAEVSMDYTKHAYELAKAISYPKGEGLALLNHGRLYYLREEYIKSVGYYERAERIFKNIEDEANTAETYNYIGIAYIAMQNYERALNYYLLSMDIWKEINDENGIAKCNYNIGLIYQKLDKDKESISYFDKASEIFSKLNDNVNTNRMNYKIGQIYKDLSKYDKALEYFQKTLESYEASKDSSKIASSLNNIGNLYFELGNNSKALEYYQKWYSILKIIGNETKIAFAIINIGNVYLDLGNYRDALKAYDEALQKIEGKGFKGKESIIQNNIGLIYKIQKKYTLALKYCLRSLEMREDLGDLEGAIVPLTSLSEIHLRLGNLAKALSYADRSLTTAYKFDKKLLVRDSYKLLYEINYKLQNYKTAFDYHVNYAAVRDSILSIESRRRIDQLRIMYESEKKEKQNELLSMEVNIQKKEVSNQENITRFSIAITVLILMIFLVLYSRYRTKQKANQLLSETNEQVNKANVKLSEKNELITKQKEDLQRLNKDLITSEEKLRRANIAKDKFFNIVAHDLKNPLQAILLSSYVLFNKYNLMGQKQLGEVVTNLYKTTTLYADLLENLLQWSRTQSGKIEFNPISTDLSVLLRKNINLLEGTAERKNIYLTSHVNEKTNVFADQNMINSVIRNLISNAIKFTFNRGQVTISAHENGKFVEISVEDTGVGISNRELDKLFRIDITFSTLGTSMEQGTGLGLILCKEFIEKNGGKIWVESEVDKGSIFKFTLPKAKKD